MSVNIIYVQAESIVQPIENLQQNKLSVSLNLLIEMSFGDNMVYQIKLFR